jgi:phosphoglycerate-specific signal transduction histidine kinase
LLKALTLKTREYLKLTEDMREYSAIERPLCNDDRDRINLLTEENQVLFEQITLLRSHADHLIMEYSSKTEEATTKISQYDKLESDFGFTCQERD